MFLLLIKTIVALIGIFGLWLLVGLLVWLAITKIPKGNLHNHNHNLKHFDFVKAKERDHMLAFRGIL